MSYLEPRRAVTLPHNFSTEQEVTIVFLCQIYKYSFNSLVDMAKDSNTRYISLVALIFQNAGLAIIMRYSLIFPSTDGKYITSTAVLAAEVLKLMTSSLACFILDANWKVEKFQNLLKYEGGGLMDWSRLAVPSVLYTIQNSLQYTAMSNLSAPVFQVCYQMKIITTALFSVVLLNRHISSLQWGSVVALTVGVALVQISQQNGGNDERSNSMLGLMAVVVGCLTSGFAGVYFEMVLKSSRASIWVRNIQLSFIGIFMATGGCLLKDYDNIFPKEGGIQFLKGYNHIVWNVILFQAAGGMIVALVVKYADNIIKNFATSFSILLSAFTSAILFRDVIINFSFVIGALMVMTSTYTFGYKPPARIVSRQDLELSLEREQEKEKEIQEFSRLLREDGEDGDLGEPKTN